MTSADRQTSDRRENAAQVIEDLGLSSIDAEWIQAIWALVFAALLIICGRFGDRVGRRKVFLAGAVARSSLAASTTQIGGVAAIFLLPPARLEDDVPPAQTAPAA